MCGCGSVGREVVRLRLEKGVVVVTAESQKGAVCEWWFEGCPKRELTASNTTDMVDHRALQGRGLLRLFGGKRGGVSLL